MQNTAAQPIEAPTLSVLRDDQFRIGDKVSFPYGEARYEGTITGYSGRWISLSTAPVELYGTVRDGFAVDTQFGMRLLERGPELTRDDVQEWQGHVWRRDAITSAA